MMSVTNVENIDSLLRCKVNDIDLLSVGKQELNFFLNTLKQQTKRFPYCPPARELMSIEKLNLRHIVDRSLTLDMGFPYTILTSIPDMPSSFSMTFRELCDQRAVDIITQSTVRNLEITVLYSGGIDSTGVLCSLLKNNVDLKRLRIVLTQRSIEEYPLFWDETVSKLRYQIVDVIDEGFYENSLVVSGALGDQIFGLSNACMMPPKEKIDLEKEFPVSVVEWLEPWIKKSPLEIVSKHDFIWWMCFSLTWQHVQLSIIRKLTLTKHQLDFSHFVDFYGSREFQLWSMCNHDEKIKDTWKSYKYPIKDYIYEYNQDADYRANKIKLPSLMHAYRK
jgi:hypothetical protein